MVSSAAPESANWPRWIRCQSVIRPCSAEYWHIGAMTMRLGSVSPPTVRGLKSMVCGTGSLASLDEPPVMEASLCGGQQFVYSRTMELSDALHALAALAHPGRLEVFRRLVRQGPEGLAAGDIARATGSLPNTLSSNLGRLAAAGLVRSRRDGRFIIYSADYERMGALLAFLLDDCCAGRAEICAPLLALAGSGCAPAKSCA